MVKKLIIIFLSLGLLTACVSKKAREFEEKGSVQPMFIPSGYSSEKIESYYRVPNLSQGHLSTGKKLNLVPPGATKH